MDQDTNIPGGAGRSPLEGLKVVELARVLAGPWIGQALADLGADVVKVESPAGDDTRHWGPPFIERDGDRTAAYYYAANRGKSAVVADFRNAEDLAHVKALIGEADIVIENFKVGGLAKFGLDYESLSADHPRLVYCSVTGFGQDGPYAHRAGYDFLIQGMSGLMSITGEPGREPQKYGVAVTDLVSGLYGTIGVLAALEQRRVTGRGQQVDISLLDCATATLANMAMNYFASGTAPVQAGNAHQNLAPYQVFPTSDGHVIIAVGNDGQFRRLCKVLDVALADDPRFATNPARVENRALLTELLTPVVAARGQAELLAALEAATVPGGPINKIDQVFEDPQIKARGLRIDPQGVPGVRGPWKFSDATLRLDRTAPTLPKA